MGLIFYHPAGVAKRQAGPALRRSRRLCGALRDGRAQNDELRGLVELQADLIDRLGHELDELRRRVRRSVRGNSSLARRAPARCCRRSPFTRGFSGGE